MNVGVMVALSQPPHREAKLPKCIVGSRSMATRSMHAYLSRSFGPLLAMWNPKAFPTLQDPWVEDAQKILCL